MMVEPNIEREREGKTQANRHILTEIIWHHLLGKLKLKIKLIITLKSKIIVFIFIAICR